MEKIYKLADPTGADFRSKSVVLLKKAAELSVFPGADVAVIIFSGTTDEMFEYSTSDMKEILGKYKERKESGGQGQLQVAAAAHAADKMKQPAEGKVPSSSSQAHTNDNDDGPLQTTCSFTPTNISLDDIQRMGPLGEIFSKKKEKRHTRS